MSLGSWRTLSFIAAESAMLALLITLASFALRGSLSSEAIEGFGAWETAAVIFTCFFIYWAMQTLRRNQAAFWVLALLVILAQGPAIWAHNALEWSQFFGMEVTGESVRSLTRDTFWFLASLVGLMTLYRTMGLRRLDRLLLTRQLATSDRNALLLNEGIVLIGLMLCATILAFLMVLAASSLGSHQGMLSLPPWTVMTVGGNAAILFVCALFIWLTRR